MSNEPIPETANVINADLVPRVQEWLKKIYPEAHFSTPLLDDLLCYATNPEEFFMPTAVNAIRDHKDGKLETVDGALKMLPDRGLIEIHESMKRHPRATVAALAQFQHEDDKLLKDFLRRAIRRENCEGMSKDELARHLVETGQIRADQQATARRRINEIRKEDLQRLSERQLKDYRINTP